MPVTQEQVIQALRRKGYQGQIPGEQSQSQPQPTTQSQGLIYDLLNKISPPLATTVAQGARGWQAASGYSTPDFEDPTVRQLRQAEIDSLSTPPPKGLLRIGKQIVPDPQYVKPADQAKLDEDTRVRDMETESLRNSAQDNLATIQKVKEGAKYFGPLGNLPTIASPSSLIGQYGPRKEWETNINKLLSQKVIDIISEMKRVSKTGATGFGQLSEKEGAILQQASTALQKDLLPDQAMYYLNEMEKIHKKVLGGGSSEQINLNQPGQNQDNDPLGIL